MEILGRIKEKLYQKIIMSEKKENDPMLNRYEQSWPLVISDPEYFSTITNNPYLARLEKETKEYFKKRRNVHYAIGAPFSFMQRYPFAVFVDDLEPNVQEIQNYDPKLEEKIEMTERKKLYYRYSKFIKDNFPEMQFTKEEEKHKNQQIKNFLKRYALKYPNASIDESKIDQREQGQLWAALELLMQIYQSKELNSEIEQVFEILFKYKNKVISRYQYDMNEKKDTSYKQKTINFLNAVEMKDFKTIENNILTEADTYHDIIDALKKNKEIEEWQSTHPYQGFVITETGRLLLKGLVEEQEKAKESIQEYLEQKKREKQEDGTESKNPFAGVDQFQV